MKNIINIFLFIIISVNVYGQKSDFTLLKNKEVKIITNRYFKYETNFVSHENYLIVTENWIKYELAPKWELYKKQNSVKFIFDITNCEWYSSTCRSFAHTIEKDKNAVVAIGVFFYKYQTIGFHAINFLIVDKLNTFGIVFFDPQNSKIKKLTKNEINSCFFWYF